jgi:sugar diacid utilization regulator
LWGDRAAGTIRGVPTVDQLLLAPEARGLTLVAGPWAARRVEAVAIVDAMEELDAVPAGALVLLTRHASSLAAGYQLDVALRIGAERRIAALAVYGESRTSITAIRLADRARVALLAVDRGRDLGELAFSLVHAMRSDAGDVLDRVVESMEAIESAERRGSAAVLDAAREATGAAIDLAAARGGAESAPVTVDGAREAFVVADRHDPATRVAVRLAASAVARIRAAERRAMRAPARARAEVLAEMLLAPDHRLAGVLTRALDLGLAMHGWHAAARIEPAAAEGALGASLADAALDAVSATGLPWHPARVESTLVLVRTWAADPGGDAEALAEAAELLAALRATLGGAALFCGLAGPRAGADGLRTGAQEALAALAAARSLGRANVPVPIDAVALPRTLIEWLTSDAGRLATQRLLGPLDDLGPARGLAAVQTLHAWLDEQGSLVRCAERLHLHRNAVGYRIRQIRERLDVDLDDPDQRLALQLACRSRLLARA